MAAIDRIGLKSASIIVPETTESDYPIIDSNDAKGGIHEIATRTEISTIIPNRRRWGMLVYVYNEGKFYQLRPKGNETIRADESNNTDNWVEFTGGGSSTLDWVDTVKGVYNEPGFITFTQNTGDRFLVGPNAVGPVFGGKKNQIAIFARFLNEGNGGYAFSEPSDGTTLRADNEQGIIYTFKGTSSTSGNWYKEYQNVVRYIYPTSNNGRTFSYTTVDQHPLTGYTYCVFYSTFATSNSGTMSLSIDGNNYLSVKKISSNSLVELEANDIGANLTYQLTYDNGGFQVSLGGAGSGGTIGPAEDNDYTDGLYPDFTPSTEIGVPIDRFNQILKALVPPPAPNLSSWSVNPQSQFVSGKLGYARADESGLGIQSAELSSSLFGRSDASLANPFTKGDWSGYRLGITSRVSQTDTGDNFYQNITGILNSDVSENPSRPTPAYVANSIGNGLTGSLVLYLNGSTVSNVDLGVDSAINTTSGQHGGFQLSAPTASKFSNGTPFETFWNRTGNYVVKRDSSLMKTGYNYIQVRHFLPTSTINLLSYEFITDASTTLTTFNSPSVTYNINVNNVKTLSGIKYWTQLQVNYSCVANNVYRNTYSADSDAVRFQDSTVDPTLSTIYNGRSVANNGNAKVFITSTETIPLPNPNEVSDPVTLNTSFNLINNSSRKVNGTSIINMTVKRTVQGTKTGGNLTIQNLFIDNVPSTSTDLFEDFNSEEFRKPNSNFNKVSDLSNWLSTSSLLTVYRNALQVADGRLLYPSLNFEEPGDTNTNPNTGNSDTDYRTCKSSVVDSIHGADNYRTYTRVFNLGPNPNQSRGKWIMRVVYNSTSFVTVGTPLTNQTSCYCEVKLPHDQSRSTTQLTGGLIGGSSGPVTGWLDACRAFDPQVVPADGAGCRTGNVPSSGGDWQIEFGTRTTFFSGGYVLVRITAGKDWQGYIESIELDPD